MYTQSSLIQFYILFEISHYPDNLYLWVILDQWLIVMKFNSLSIPKSERPFTENIDGLKIKIYVVWSYNS